MEKIIKIRTLRHEVTGLLMAVSDDLRGLTVHAHTAEELEERLPSVVKDLLESAGKGVWRVELVRDRSISLPDFSPPAFIANAELRSAA